MTKLKLAREVVKLELRRQGIKLSYVTSANVTKAARALMKHMTYRELLADMRNWIVKDRHE